jgi:molybdopterin molybdotransferase
MLGTIIPPLGVEPVALDQGLGRVLRETVVAAEDQPPFARSAMDGFAVRLDDESSEFRAVDFLRAGDWRPRSLALGEAVRIATGAALPGDGLQIILIEDAEISGDRVRIPQRDAARHVRERGEDARRGDTLLAPPRRLSAGALALLASLGVPRLSVTRLPRIVHIATGNEIVAPGQTPLPGQIRDSNSTLVRAFLAARGLPVLQHRAPEDFATTRALLLDPAQGAPAADLLLISGGASVGGHDFTRRLLTELGCEILIARVASRPGKPLIVARRGAAVAFGLPGNPLAHFVCLHLFVQRALDTLAGLPGETPFQEGVLADALDHDSAGRETLWPACQSIVGGASALEPLRWSSSGDLTPLARANALIRVPGGVRGLARGARVPFVSTTPPS